MKITSIVENTSAKGLPVEHGLSLYVELTNGKRVLFDMGQHNLFVENAARLGLSIADVDVAVVSHGHYDHGGGLRTFLQANHKAKVYIHQDAFLPHFSLRDSGLRYIGIETELKEIDRVFKCCDLVHVGEDMLLFADVHGDCCCPMGNRLLFGPEPDRNDTFRHEQNLIIREGNETALFAGCAHNGIVNIIRKAESILGYAPTKVLAGMHLVKSGLSEADENIFISTLADELMKYKETKYYTMHCTGIEQYEKLKAIMGGQIEYLSCGDSVVIKKIHIPPTAR